MSNRLNAGERKEEGRFSLVVGGPFNSAMTRLGLTAADQLPTHRAAIGLAMLAWLVPAMFVILQSVFDSHYSGWSYFTDSMAYTRYLIAILVLIATERYADSRTLMLVDQFRDARIVSDDSLSGFTSALDAADRRSSSRIVELCILTAAIVWSTITAQFSVEHLGSSWMGAQVDNQVVLSWAGEAARLFSNSLFLFLVMRWIWRFFVWALLLYRISQLPLQLTPQNSDRAAGLGFLSIYPSVFTGLVFAMSCVVASAFLHELDITQYQPSAVWFALALWLVIILILFIGPLLVFYPMLYRVREQALLDYGSLTNQHHLAFNQKWIDEESNGADMVGTTDPSTATDLNACMQAVRDMHLIPVDFPAVMQLVIAAGLPMLTVVVREVPLKEVLKWFLGVIF